MDCSTVTKDHKRMHKLLLYIYTYIYIYVHSMYIATYLRTNRIHSLSPKFWHWSMFHLMHGLRTPNFVIEIPKFWAWVDKFWSNWGIFGWTISTHLGTVSPLSMFSIIQPLFLKKTKSLYPHPKYLFGIGIRIWVAKN